MTINNPLLYNAVLAGAYAGSGFGSNPVAGTPATTVYAAQAASAVALAAAVDALIVGDSTITTSGATTAPTTGTIQDAQVSKSGLMREITAASLAEQGQTTTPSGPALSSLAAGIAAKYSAAIASLDVG